MTSLSSSADFLLCVESSFWYLQLPGIVGDMQLLSVASHSCALAHAPPRTWKARSPALSTTTLHGSMGVGSEVLEEGQDFWNGGSQDRVGMGGSAGPANY